MPWLGFVSSLHLSPDHESLHDIQLAHVDLKVSFRSVGRQHGTVCRRRIQQFGQLNNFLQGFVAVSAKKPFNTGDSLLAALHVWKNDASAGPFVPVGSCCVFLAIAPRGAGGGGGGIQCAFASTQRKKVH